MDFTKRIHNSNKFRSPALYYEANGYYCPSPEGTSEYMSYWNQEMDYCLHGFKADDGDYITGFHYFYLNYCPIIRNVDVSEFSRKEGKVVRKTIKDIGFPHFFDYDYFFFQYVEEAQEAGKFGCVLKSRDKGYSYKGGSMLCRNYYLMPNSKGYVYAADTQYLDKDGIITKAWQYMDFIDEHTGWSKKRQVIDRQLHRRASFLVTDRFGNKKEQGYKSEIIGASLKSDPDKLRGKRGQLIFFEEGGSFSELAAAWAIARPSVERDGYAFGFMLVWGTGGGTNTDFKDLKDMFYRPDSYNIYSVPNIWDEAVENTKCGFYVPQYTNMDKTDPITGKRLYMDDDGNTFYKESLDFILEERRKVIEGSTNSQMVDRYIAEHSTTPREACLELSGNIFPKKDLEQQLTRIRTNKSLQAHKQVGELNWVDSKPEWTIKKSGDITHYPLDKTDDARGSIVIWEHPAKDASPGLYIAGCDPYDHDISGTNSLGSVFIYKRFQNFEEYSDLIVAEYTGRPETADAFYENVRKLLIYYNAHMLYENQNKGLFSYFANNHCDYLLLDQPDIIGDITGVSKTQRRKGTHMTAQIKNAIIGWIKDELIEEFAPGHKNTEKILSEPLLEELISYNDKGNFDRVIAFGLVMMYKRQIHNTTVRLLKEEERRPLIPEGLFSKEWFNDSYREAYPYSNDTPVFDDWGRNIINF